MQKNKKKYNFCLGKIQKNNYNFFYFFLNEIIKNNINHIKEFEVKIF